MYPELIYSLSIFSAGINKIGGGGDLFAFANVLKEELISIKEYHTILSKVDKYSIIYIYTVLYSVL